MLGEVNVTPHMQHMETALSQVQEKYVYSCVFSSRRISRTSMLLMNILHHVHFELNSAVVFHS